MTLDQAKSFGAHAIPRNESHNGKVLAALYFAAWSGVASPWVSVVALMKASDSINVHSRIAELRKMGFTIENKKVHFPETGATHSSYRLMAPESAIHNPQSAIKP